jgi:hypothetical protein
MTLCKKKVYGSLKNNTNYCFLYQNWLSHLEKCQKLGMVFYFYFFSFAKEEPNFVGQKYLMYIFYID